MAKLQQILGNTWCIQTASKTIPLWRAGGKDVVLIDSGDPGRERLEMTELLQCEGLHVSAILTTHAHRDHTGNHALFQETHSAQIVAPLHSAGVLSTALGLKAAFEASTLRETLTFAETMQCRVDEILLPGQTEVGVSGGHFLVLAIPGHAPDHTGYVTPDGVACLGDLFFTADALAEVRLPYSFCWETDLESRARALSWDYPVFLLAHSGVCPSLQEADVENRAVMERAMELVISLATSKVTFCSLLAQINQVLFIRPGSKFKRDAIERSSRSLVHFLQDTGRLRAEQVDGVLHYQAV